MVSCVKCHLTKNKHSKESGVTFHRFPTKDHVYRMLWIGFVDKPNWQPNKYSLMCSQHFEPDCFDQTSIAFIRLKEDAVPTREIYRTLKEKSTKPDKKNSSNLSESYNGVFCDIEIKSEPVEQDVEEYDNHENVEIKTEPKDDDESSSEDEESSSDHEDNGNTDQESEDEGETPSSSDEEIEIMPLEKSKLVVKSEPVTASHEPDEDPRKKKYTVADILAFCRGVDSVDTKDICLFQNNINHDKDKNHENDSKANGKNLEKPIEIKVGNIKAEISERVIEYRKKFCPVCNKSDKPWFKSKDNKKYECKQCHASLSSITQMRKHLESHERERHRCKQCSLSFSCQDCLTKHISKSHESDMYKCNECAKNYPSKSQLVRHIVKIHAGNKFSCNYCEKSFPHKESLKYHLNKHEGVKFYCAHCPKFVYNKESLKKHLDHNHSELLFPCDKCSKVFRCSYNLQLHKKHMHSNIKAQFKCSECSKILSSRNNLNVHLKMHAGVRYDCKYCPKQFVSKQNWKEHILRHEGATFICKECNINFSRRGNLLRHVRYDHNHYNNKEIELIDVDMKTFC